jgi:hypothetical protein
MKRKTTLRAAITDDNLLGKSLPGESWDGWRALLLAAMGEKLTPPEREHYQRLTQRSEPPAARVEEFWAIAGRRGGKSRAIAVLVSYLAALCDYRDKLVRGEKGIVLCLAPTQMQAAIVLDYVAGILQESPILTRQIVKQTSETLELANGIIIDVRSASFRRLRGQTCVAAVFDECAFFHSDESSNPDIEIINAVRPSLGTTNGMLAVISSPYARRGALFDAFKQHFGAGGSDRILVAKGATRDFNPTYSQEKIDREYERDPAYAGAEYGGEFRLDIEEFISRETVAACTDGDVFERPYDRALYYSAFVDMSGGARDSSALAIVHMDSRAAVLDVLREVRAPHSPEGAIEQFTALLKKYNIHTVRGDRYAGEFPAEQFAKRGFLYEPSERSKSEIFADALPMLNSRTCGLVDNKTLERQLVGLERRTSRGGKDTIGHAPGGFDDVANAVCGALVHATAAHCGDPRFYQEIKYPRLGIV